MRIEGKWLLCDDGVERPVISGEIFGVDGSWESTQFLVDTGADRTVFSAATHAKLGLLPLATQDAVGGLGGVAESVVVETQIRLTRETGSSVLFRGQYAAVTQIDALDIDVLGRDITGLFAVVVDQPGNVVSLLGQRHRYTIEQD
jgi:predicted aspartyl protease